MSTPPLVPNHYDSTIYMVLDDLGELGRAYVETNENQADLESIIGNIETGQYANPIRIFAFNTAEGWSRDVTEEIAREIQWRAQRAGVISVGARAFTEFNGLEV